MFHVELKTFVCNIVTNYYNCIDYISFISYNILDLIISPFSMKIHCSAEQSNQFYLVLFSLEMAIF